MGLSADFKKYVSATFPEACTPPGGVPHGVVIDSMVLLHSFVPREDDSEPAQRLVDTLFAAVRGARAAAFCFDVSANTPAAKEMEWKKRPKPACVVTEASISEYLMLDLLPDYASLIASRGARTLLCQWLVNELVGRMRFDPALEALYFIGASETPVVYRRAHPGGAISATQRLDLLKSYHGEADISGIYAAHVLKDECGVESVELRTSDTDWVVIGMLNAFPGLRTRLQHFDRASRSFVSWHCNLPALTNAVHTKYGINEQEFALLALSKGSDYVEKSIAAFPDWGMYMDATSRALRAVKARRGSEIVTKTTVDALALHTVLVEASETKKRCKLNYSKGDGHLQRLGWNLLYVQNAPLRGGHRLDCTNGFGWSRQNGDINHVKIYKDVVTFV
jgi:hypothetical protein